jgi:hypothetical protein
VPVLASETVPTVSSLSASALCSEADAGLAVGLEAEAKGSLDAMCHLISHVSAFTSWKRKEMYHSCPANLTNNNNIKLKVTLEQLKHMTGSRGNQYNGEQCWFSIKDTYLVRALALVRMLASTGENIGKSTGENIGESVCENIGGW